MWGRTSPDAVHVGVVSFFARRWKSAGRASVPPPPAYLTLNSCRTSTRYCSSLSPSSRLQKFDTRGCAPSASMTSESASAQSWISTNAPKNRMRPLTSSVLAPRDQIGLGDRYVPRLCVTWSRFAALRGLDHIPRLLGGQRQTASHGARLPTRGSSCRSNPTRPAAWPASQLVGCRRCASTTRARRRRSIARC